MQVQSRGEEDPLEEEMATHSSILARGNPRTEEPGGLQSMGSQESDTTERLNHHHHQEAWGWGVRGLLTELHVDPTRESLGWRKTQSTASVEVPQEGVGSLK